MNYWELFKNNRSILAFGIIFTFYSGFGQTFVLSLYIPSLIAEFGISQSYFSALYAIATLLSGLTIVFAGRIIDKVPIMRFSLAVVFGIIFANLFAGLSVNIIMLVIGLFLLRFFGQGLLSHTAMTTMGRYFHHSRGKALSIAFLGFPLAEAIFPITVITIIGVWGWRESFLASSGFIVLTLLPLSIWLISNFNNRKVTEKRVKNTKASDNKAWGTNKQWGQRQVLGNFNFYIFAPTTFIAGFSFTALFFFQTFIAEFKGWSVQWMALSIGAYAISSLVFSILAGPLTDRFSARKLFPFTLLPLAAGVLTLALFNHPAMAWIFWFLAGASGGANPTISNALYAETYGVKTLGSVRSIFTFVMVVSTAAGPIVYSLLSACDFNYNQIHLMLTGVIILNMLYIVWGFRKLSKSIQ